MNKHLYLLLLLAGLMIAPRLDAQNIYFSIQNETLIGMDYHFDVFMHCDQANTLHSRGHVYIIYDTAAFDVGIVAAGKASYTDEVLLNDSVVLGPGIKFAKYLTFPFLDNSANRLALTWSSNFLNLAGSPIWHTVVPTVPTKLYHMVLTMKNNALPANLSLDLALMDNQIFYFQGTDPNIPYGSGVLPAELASFTAKQQGQKGTLLEWSTLREINNDYFLIEKKRGFDGQFETVGRVTGNGNTHNLQGYEFTDYSPMDEVNFYRLRQVDFNGTASLSDVVELRFDNNGNERLDIYPNPASACVHLSANFELEGKFRYTISDLTGKQITQAVLDSEQIKNGQPIDISKLPKGVYLLRLQGSGGKSYTDRIIKK